MTHLHLIREQLAWLFRYPPAPEITADTLLGEWFSDMDRLCVQMALDEALGVEIGDAEAGAWGSVGDIIATVGRMVGQGLAA